MNTSPEKESATENLIRLIIFLNTLALIVSNRNSLPDPVLQRVRVPSKVFLQADNSPTAYLFPDLIVMYAGDLPVKVVCPNGVDLKQEMVLFVDLSPRDQLDYTKGLNEDGLAFINNHPNLKLVNVGSPSHAGCIKPIVIRKVS